MSTLSTTYTFSAGTTIESGKVNQNFTDVRTWANGNIDTTNLSGSAGITGSQIASNTLTEANMIAGATGLAKGSFSAYRNAALSGLGNPAVVVFDTEEWDVSSWYDISTGRFTPQVAGYFRLSARLKLDPASGIYGFSADVYKNGSVFKKGQHVTTASSGDDPSSVVAALVSANGSTDYFDIRCSSFGVSFVVGASECYFQGELVGRS